MINNFLNWVLPARLPYPRRSSYQLSEGGLFSGGHPRLVSWIHVRLVLRLRLVVVTASTPAAPTVLVNIVLLDPARARGPHAHGRRVVAGGILGRVVLDGEPVGVGGQDLRPEDAPLVRRRRVRVPRGRPEPVVQRRKGVRMVVQRRRRVRERLLRVDRQRLAASMERVVPLGPPVRLVLPVGNEAHLETAWLSLLSLARCLAAGVNSTSELASLSLVLGFTGNFQNGTGSNFDRARLVTVEIVGCNQCRWSSRMSHYHNLTRLYRSRDRTTMN